MAWVGALLLGAALVLLCYTALTWFWTVRRMAGISASIPGPRTLPLVGNFLDVPFGNLQCFVKNLIRDHGYLFRLWIGPLLLVFVLDPDDLEVVTSPAAAAACGDKPKYGYNIARQIIGHGMLTKNGASHRRSRKLIQPSLHREVLAQFQPLMHIEAVALARDLQAKAQTGEVFNITPMIAKTSLNAAFRTVLSADEELYKMMGTRLRLLVDGIERQSHLIMLRAMRPWLLCDAIFRFHEHYDDYYYLTNQYEQMILDVLEYREKRGNKQSAAGAASDDDPDAPQPRRRQAFLDLLLSSEGSRSLSRDELLGEVKLFTIASAATSQDTMATQMLLLALLPDVQAKIQSELDDLFGDSDRPLEMDDLKHLDYLDRFIKEGLRMLPPFPLFARDCKKDLPLRSGHTIPAGAYILFSPLATQHNPKYFPEPLRFDPDRWLPEAMAKRPPCSYFAFSAGPRNCIGMPYATIFVKTCIATVLRRYTLLPDPDGPQDISQIKMRLGLTYYPRDGSKVRVAMRRAMAATPG